MRFELSRTFAAPRVAGYEYMTDLHTWHEWAPVCIPDVEGAKFKTVGDLVAYRYRPMGIPLRGTMTLVEKVEGERVRYRFSQKTFPDVEMEWLFHNAGAHAFTLTVMVEVADPTWWDKTYQWMSMIPVTLKRDVNATLQTLHEHFSLHEVKKAS